jgi:hypothetical protein
MKKKLLLCCLFLQSLGTMVWAQSENALYFDNVDDQVIAPGASSMIAGSSNISLTMWVNPMNPAPTFPDFDGFAGIRNNTDADFYILHLNSTSVEARFRNSSGTNFDIVATGVTLNTWQHFALTYDGTTLTLYVNGVIAGSVAASGTIANTSESLYLGNLVFQGTNFLLNGKLDEVSLWSKTLTQAEIDCIYSGAIDPTSTDLHFYFRFNQGIANGNNGTITTLNNATGMTNGTISGFALAGTTSNFVGGVTTPNSSVITDVLCPGETYTFGTQTITAPGNYYEAFGTAGCDSIVELVLTAPTINTVISQSGPILTAQQAGASYQWINCVTLAPVPGAITQQYVATANGQYACVVTVGGCSDTSVCANVVNVGIQELNGTLIQASPNPFENEITLTSGTSVGVQTVIITDLAGREIYRKEWNGSSTLKISSQNWEAGTYFLRLSDQSGSIKLIKN